MTRAARTAVRAARWTECALLFASVFALVLASAVLSSGQRVESDDVLLSLLCAGLGATAWWLPNRMRVDQVARHIDRSLEFGGAFLTAYEVESGRLPSTPPARALAERVLARMTRARAIRAALPHSASWIAAPFVAAAMLALALDTVRTSDENAASVATTRSLANGLGALRGSVLREGTLSGEELEQLDRLLEEARGMAEAAVLGEADLDRRVAEFAQQLESFAEQSPANAALQRSLEEGQVLADQALSALRGQPKSPQSTQNPFPDEGSGVSSGQGQGTIRGSSGAAETETNSTADSTERIGMDHTSSSVGVYSRGRWWPARHDDLVASWMDACRSFD